MRLASTPIASSSQENQARVIYNIQVLRALAAVLVVIYHAEIVLRPVFGELMILRAGQSGVDLFFVISGFVMVHVTAGKLTLPGDFMLNRIVRVAPLYWLLTFGVYLLGWIAPRLVSSTSHDPMELLKSLAFIPFVKGNGSVTPIVFVGWTLNYEMFFYCIFAFALTLGRERPRLAVIMTSVLFLAIMTVAHSLRVSVALAFYGSPIVLEFAMGMFVGLLYERSLMVPEKLAVVTIGIGTVGLLSSILWTDFATLRWLVTGVPAASVVAGFLSLERAGYRFKNRILQLLGGSSYSLYLIHMFLIIAIIKISGHFSLKEAVASFFALAIVGSILAGLVVHLYVERPLTAALRHWVSQARTHSLLAS